jgi:hypothetical protein
MQRKRNSLVWKSMNYIQSVATLHADEQQPLRLLFLHVPIIQNRQFICAAVAVV